MIFGTKRKKDESETDGVACLMSWILKAHTAVKDLLSAKEIQDWVEVARSRAFSFACKAVLKRDGRWTVVAMKSVVAGKRNQGHPAKRWSDDIITHFKHVIRSNRTCSKQDWVAQVEIGFDWQEHIEAFAAQHWS